jgi:transposase
MINIPDQTPIYVVHHPVSFNRGLDGMRGLCVAVTKQDPINHGYFLFINKGRNQIRIIWYDGQGFLLCTKRLSKGRYSSWPVHSDDVFSFLEHFQAQSLVCGSSGASDRFLPIWKRVTAAP